MKNSRIIILLAIIAFVFSCKTFNNNEDKQLDGDGIVKVENENHDDEYLPILDSGKIKNGNQYQNEENPPILDSSATNPPIVGDGWVKKEEKFYIVPVLYGTNRKLSGSKKIKDLYTGNPENRIDYGIINVSIPFLHKYGELERPGWMDKVFGDPNDKTKFIDFVSCKRLTNKEFNGTLRDALSKTSNGEAFVFVHGYNNSFADAALRTAQLFYDLKYQGVPILYSWPSKAGTKDYLYDSAQATNSVRLFQEFIADIVSKNKGKKINIIAHSMGNRILTKALSDLPKAYPRTKFHHIIMAAPDVYTDDFKNNDVKGILASCKDVTLYASSKDKALKMSNKMHSNIPRLGLAGKQLFVMNPIVTIDISKQDCGDFLKHTCFAKSKPVIDDISSLLKDIPALKRKPAHVGNSEKIYYLLEK